MPDEIHNLLLRAAEFRQANQLDKAAEVYQQLLQQHTGNVQVHLDYGDLQKRLGNLTMAAEHFNRAICLAPNLAVGHSCLGGVYRLMAKHEEAETHYRRAVELAPNQAHIHSNLLMSMLYTGRYNEAEKFTEFQRWEQRHTHNLQVYTNYSNNNDPGRQLRIGYVSGDFRRHPMALFLVPVLSTHNRHNFNIFTYSLCEASHDPVNRLMRSMVSNWRDAAQWNDSRMAEQIRADRIDILVDLVGHTENHRLLVFARKPAPVQVTWLGFPATTGLTSMDYRITDAWADPPGDTEQFHSEHLVRLENGFSCFSPAAEEPFVGLPPQESNGFITFGSLNNLAKITSTVVDTWAALLGKVQTSRLILKNHSLNDTGVAQQLLSWFADRGVDPQRIILKPTVKDYAEHLEVYNDIDIGLDTFPYNGTTTTFEALWMGVPVVTLAGQSHVSRVGTSILSRIGLQRLVAQNRGAYLDIAMRLIPEAPELRLKLRNRMMGSSLCQAHIFTCTLENAYREMWRKWCEAGDR